MSQATPTLALHKLTMSAPASASISLTWLLRLRFLAVLGQAITLAFSVVILRLELPLWELSLLVLFTALSNWLLLFWLKGRAEAPLAISGGVMVIDTLILTGLLYFSGGPMNPFSVLYLVHVTLAAVVLGVAWGGAMVVLSVACYALLFLWHVPVADMEHAHHGGPHLSTHLQGMWVAFALTGTMILYAVGKVSEALRAREAELAEAEQARVRSEKLLSLSTLSAGAAHELSTPLGTIAVAARELARNLTLAAGENRDQAVADLDLIRQEVARCRGILRHMAGKAGQVMGEGLEATKASEVLELLRGRIPDAGSITTRVVKEAELSVPLEGLLQVLVGLVQNGLAATREAAVCGGKEQVSIEAEARGERVAFVVTDHGHGMPPEVLACAGEPFFTTKAPGEGMGLGLFLARSFAARCGGSLTLVSNAGKGTTVTVELPTRAAA